MKKKWLTGLLSGLLAASLASPAMAADGRTIGDESIYDTLTDRFFNKDSQNDYDIDTLDPSKFSGGDFAGIVEKLDHVEKMGFTMLSIGPVFASDTYDGRQVIDYGTLERHFGTEEELKAMLTEAHDLDIRVMVDIPTQSLSPDHLWISENPDWFTRNEDGTVALDTGNSEVQEALTQAIEEFIGTYEVDGLRLLDAEALDPAFITQFSADLKAVRDVYVIGDSELEAAEGLDAAVAPNSEEILRSAYKNVNQPSEEVAELIEESAGKLIRIDSLQSSRFTVDAAAENAFPPTRWRLVFTQLLTMPGTPVIQYGSETAMNGEGPPDSHQILDLRVDEELIDAIGNLNTLRNSSEALRNGETDVLHAEDGWLVYKRANEQEAWIIAINNTDETKSFDVPAEEIGSDQEMRGLFESNLVRENEDGSYRIVLNRETAEAFTVSEAEGFNTGYIIAMVLAYLLFMVFLWLVWRKGKQRKRDEQMNK